MLGTDPYHFLHDQFRYRPHRRRLAEACRAMAGACVEKPFNIYPQAFMPPGSSPPIGRPDGLLAGVVPFALGADTITPYCYELMKIIPGFPEALDETRRLGPHMAGRRPYAFATVVNPEQSQIYGHHHANWGADYLVEVAEVMYRAGLPWRWLWDNRLEDLAEGPRGPLVVPDAHCLTQAQIELIRRTAESGEGVLWIGAMPREAWNGSDVCLAATPQRAGDVELSLVADNELLAGLTQPLVLRTHVGATDLKGTVLATMDGSPALVVSDSGGRREAWLAGLPQHSYVRPGDHGSHRTPTGGVALIARLLRWLSPSPPLAYLDPYPPKDAYAELRPWDRRAVPTVELLPMAGERSLLAIVFPYLPLACETALVINIPKGARLVGLREVWSGLDRADAACVSSDGQVRLPISIPGDADLLAVEARWEE